MAQMTETKLRVRFTDAEQAMLRTRGPMWLGIVEFYPRRRGARVRPARTGLHRTEEQAQADVDGRRYVDVARCRRVVLVNYKTEEV